MISHYPHLEEKMMTIQSNKKIPTKVKDCLEFKVEYKEKPKTRNSEFNETLSKLTQYECFSI